MWNATEKRTDPNFIQVGLLFKEFNKDLMRLLVDAEGNMVGAAGTLDDYDLQLLTQALSIDHRAQESLATILDEQKFHSTYFEGNRSGVYIIEFGSPYVVSLAVICGTDVKPGMVWLYSKRAATIVNEVLCSIPQPRNLPRLQA